MVTSVSCRSSCKCTCNNYSYKEGVWHKIKGLHVFPHFWLASYAAYHTFLPMWGRNYTECVMTSVSVQKAYFGHHEIAFPCMERHFKYNETCLTTTTIIELPCYYDYITSFYHTIIFVSTTLIWPDFISWCHPWEIGNLDTFFFSDSPTPQVITQFNPPPPPPSKGNCPNQATPRPQLVKIYPPHPWKKWLTQFFLQGNPFSL